MEFDRDAYHVTLDGSLHLLAPVGGVATGAVFIGAGEFALTPAHRIEQQHLAVASGDDHLTVLRDTFDTAVIFDSALIQNIAADAKAGAADTTATKAFDDFLNRERKDFATNFHIRLLQEQLDKTPQPLFLMFVRGKKYGPALLAVDPRGADALRLFSIGDAGEKTMLYNADRTKGGIWYLAHLVPEYKSGTASLISHPDASRYVVDTTIAPDAEVSGTTSMTFSSVPGDRVLPISIARNLRIDDVQFATSSEGPWTAIPFIQEKANEDADAAVVFPEPLKAATTYVLKITYHGIGKEVLRDAGDGNYTVGSRDSWYPNLGAFSDVADFELTFRSPQKSKNQVVSVGQEVSNTIEGDQRVAVWKSTHPLRVAGFNYGNFKKMSQTDNESGMNVEVYTNPGEPDIIRAINQALSSEPDDDGFMSMSGGNVRVDTARLAQAAFADGVNTSRTGNVYFGALPDKRLAITQQSAWFYGQSWPNLVYLPYLAFVGSTTRTMLLGMDANLSKFVDEVGAHEVAHQWWGHAVGWNSYHDVWLSEGFAEFTSGLVLQMRKGMGGYNEFMERKRRNILEKPRGARLTNQAAGPISEGYRLATWQDPEAYNVIVYDKGAYVLHMLRMLMMDWSKPDREETFRAMMHDFVSSYSGKNASTADFQRVVEKYAPQRMKIAQSGTLGWFFDQWVRDTTIPRLASKIDVKPLGGGKYKVVGTITQSEVTDNFATIVPMYVSFEKNSFFKFGDIVLVGNATRDVDVDLAFPKQPREITINAMHDVLTR